jgi:hypothetical protein
MPINPSYSGGRDQKDQGSKPAQANSSRDPILKKLSQKRAGGVAQSVGPVLTPKQSPSTTHKKKVRRTSLNATKELC